ncbi:hypothetical protein GA417_05535 [Poseidonibacter ostreae]|uniref:hypothetical protein n=1 Tax=Poseidonibacter ostreae TaxID=2654171 RepID=UPI001264F937|nr:hypothetical protein [Poseidonibacter ostreae]KAB7886412.1 hypothetical protein GA417_05535 [Poseidonibacter ostreae]
MTVMDQLIRDYEQSENLNKTLYSELEKKELEFINQLKSVVQMHEQNVENIMNKYEENIKNIKVDYQIAIESLTMKLKSLMKNAEITIESAPSYKVQFSELLMHLDNLDYQVESLTKKLNKI